MNLVPPFSVNELIICYHVLSDPFSTHSPHPWRPFQAKHTIHLWNEHWQHLWEWISLHCCFTLQIICHWCHMGIMVSQISGNLQRTCQSSISLVLFGENPPVTGWFPTLRASNAESIFMFDITMEFKPLIFAHRVYYLCYPNNVKKQTSDYMVWSLFLLPRRICQYRISFDFICCASKYFQWN